MTYDIEVKDIPAQTALGVRATCEHDQIGSTLGPLYMRVGAAVTEQNLDMAGAPFCVYEEWREIDCDLLGGCPVTGEPKVMGDVVPYTLGGCPAATTLHVGPYDQLGLAHEAIKVWMKENAKSGSLAWEVYIDDPESVPPDALKTIVAWRLE